MKNDKLLQHQKRRLDALFLRKNPCPTHDAMWISRFCEIYHDAICRSLKRYRRLVCET